MMADLLTSEQIWELDFIFHYGDLNLSQSIYDMTIRQIVFTKKYLDRVNEAIQQKMDAARTK